MTYDRALDILEEHRACPHRCKEMGLSACEEVGHYSPHDYVAEFGFGILLPDVELPCGKSLWEVRSIEGFIWEQVGFDVEWLEDDLKGNEPRVEEICWRGEKKGRRAFWYQDGYGNDYLLVPFINPYDRKLEVIRTAWGVLRIQRTIEGMREWFQSEEFVKEELNLLKEWNPEFFEEAIHGEYEEAA